jgi:hypothetical protein
MVSFGNANGKNSQSSVYVSPPSTLRQAISTGKVSFLERWIADYPDAKIIYLFLQ